MSKKNEWQEWILYMLHAVTQTAQLTYHKINAIRQLIDNTAGQEHEWVDLMQTNQSPVIASVSEAIQCSK